MDIMDFFKDSHERGRSGKSLNSTFLSHDSKKRGGGGGGGGKGITTTSIYDSIKF